MSKWDIYYYMTFIVEETGKAPTTKQIYEKFNHYDKEMI